MLSEMGIKYMRERTTPITPTEARRSLYALDVLSGKVTEPPKRKPIQRESQIQTALFEWANLSAGKYPELKLMFHIPNGGRRDVVEAAHLKQQGVKAGVPDLCLPVARGQYHGLYLELKAEGGRHSESQKAWLDDLNKQGYKAVTAYGFDEAQTAIEDYLNEKQKNISVKNIPLFFT